MINKASINIPESPLYPYNIMEQPSPTATHIATETRPLSTEDIIIQLAIQAEQDEKSAKLIKTRKKIKQTQSQNP